MNRIFYALLVCLTLKLQAQELPTPRNIDSAYARKTRQHDGRPGINYWQNSANYTITVSFNPDNRLLTGHEIIHYRNNSPDTLNEIWFKLYPNIYKKGSPREAPLSPSDIGEGVTIDSMQLGNELIAPAGMNISGTNMMVPAQHILPGQEIESAITWHYTLNKTSHLRTGEIIPGSDFIAYFFPRIAVYDDIDGWNKNPYIGSQEFYNDFCNFDVTVKLPQNYLAWATGDLANANEVLNTQYVDRIHRAEQSDDVTTIIDSSDLRNGNITKTNDQNDWHFTAKNVTDFVFAVSNQYLWKASSLVVDPASNRRTRVDAVFNPKHKDYFNVIDYARKTVQAMSYSFPAWPFPYPHETVFDGLDQMEYPMMVNDNPLESKEDEIELTDHEIFHTMFPFYMGINETKYGWMDEGWATIGEWLISPMIDSTIVDEYGMRLYEANAGKEIDLPIITLSTQQYGATYFLNSYPKPGLGYLYIKDLLGNDLFNKAIHFYIEQWHGKHPMPYDFFNCINMASGKNLNWFWKRWFFDRGYPDLAIEHVDRSKDGYSVIIRSKGGKPVPVDLHIFYADGKEETIHRSIAVWEHSDKLTLHLPPNPKLKKLVLSGTYDPDSNRSNNTYNIK